MYVWRVENENGDGPYTYQDDTESFRGDLHSTHANPFEYPGGYVDFKIGEFKSGKHIFGFLTKEQALTWFEGFIDVMAQAGYTLRRVRAKKGSITVGISGKQIVFERA